MDTGNVCLIAGCVNQQIHRHEPVMLHDGSLHRACVEHWEAIVRVLDGQIALAAM